jgi:hypothetical protein
MEVRRPAMEDGKPRKTVEVDGVAGTWRWRDATGRGKRSKKKGRRGGGGRREEIPPPLAVASFGFVLFLGNMIM